jgi:hypothetical protein
MVTNPVSSPSDSSSANAGLSLNIGTRDIDSAPPATTRSAMPDLTWAAPDARASRPDVHIRDTMPPGTVSGQPAAMTAIRGRSAACSPCTVLTPAITSCTASAGTPRAVSSVSSPANSS